MVLIDAHCFHQHSFQLQAAIFSENSYNKPTVHSLPRNQQTKFANGWQTKWSNEQLKSQILPAKDGGDQTQS